MNRLIFTVTNDLRYDQRMGRICGSLANQGYEVLLIGRKKRNSPPLSPMPYRQKRINLIFQRGPLFYAEYNTRLFFYLLFQRVDVLCAIDMDTILPVYWVSRIRGKKRVYDAHEYFSQMEEVISRPGIYRFWNGLEKKFIPRFPQGYTVCQSIADEFKKEFGVNYEVIRNIPPAQKQEPGVQQENFILYQGAVNKGRGLMALLDAMDQIDIPLVIAGDGNAMQEVKEKIKEKNLSAKVSLTGMLPPAELRALTRRAWLGINPFQQKGLNQYYSLANKFFDYIQAGLPQVTMNYPEYARINADYLVAVLIDDIEPTLIAEAVNNLHRDAVLYATLREQCTNARQLLTWEKEEPRLIAFYDHLLRH